MAQKGIPMCLIFLVIQDGTNTDFISWDIGAITNTGQRTDSDSSIIQVSSNPVLLKNSAAL